MQDPSSFNLGKFSVWKSTVLLVVFLTITPLTILASLFALVTLKKAPTQRNVPNFESHSGAKVFASLPANSPSISFEIGSSDARAELIRQYLENFDSPLAPYADTVVSLADKYGLDYRLTTAIAQQESNLCKIIPPKTYNCWGWGIHSEGTLGFSSYTEALEAVTKGLKENYIDLGLTTPTEIMAKYTPMSNGSWAFAVDKFMGEIQ